MFNNPYGVNYNTQTQNNNIDQNYLNMLDKEEEKIKNMRNNYMNRYQQPAINQTIQLAPNNGCTMRYANTIDDVNKETIYVDTPFFSKDMSVLWLKNAKGDIKTYELNEIVPLDEKDIQIQYLQSQIEELKGMIKNESNVTNDVTEQNATNTTTDDGSIRTTTKKSKSTSISKISGSKEEQ